MQNHHVSTTVQTVGLRCLQWYAEFGFMHYGYTSPLCSHLSEVHCSRYILWFVHMKLCKSKLFFRERIETFSCRPSKEPVFVQSFWRLTFSMLTGACKVKSSHAFAVSLIISRPTFMSTPWKIVLTHISHTAPDLHIAKTWSQLMTMVYLVFNTLLLQFGFFFLLNKWWHCVVCHVLLCTWGCVSEPGKEQMILLYL